LNEPVSFDGHSACLIPAPAITAPIHPKAWPANANVSARAPKVVQKIKETAVFIAVLLSDRFCCDAVNRKACAKSHWLGTRSQLLDEALGSGDEQEYRRMRMQDSADWMAKSHRRTAPRPMPRRRRHVRMLRSWRSPIGIGACDLKARHRHSFGVAR
jgi:hypothetical protein